MLKKTLLAFGLFAIALTGARAQAKDIVDTAVGAGQFTTLVKLVQEAGLVETLKGKGPFTVLAPSDDAFKKVPKEVVDRLLADKKLLTQVLTYHVIAGKVMSSDLKNGARPKTVQGETVRVRIQGGTVQFNNAKVAKADIGASNGVIHVIDTVILPQSVMKALGLDKAKDKAKKAY
ncbi:MAG: fasciclin domain-containing protein [Fimbriimonadales bacterium]|nr:fasciclin domain-containing protein [Fimbriimonadales bacterium]